METLFYLGLIFVLGALTEWLSPKLNIPRVVGYLLLGLLIGPEVLAVVPDTFVQNSNLIIDLSLSIIAVLIGARLKASSLKGHTKEVINITLFQSLITFAVVVVGFIFIANIFVLSSINVVIMALFFGAIASATAPATPIAIIHELNARGNFTSTYLAVVAIDDAVALILFSLALTIATAMLGSTLFDWMSIVNAVMIIVFSSLLGAVGALINALVDKLFVHHKGMETIATIGLIFMVYSLSEFWSLEPLLAAMIMGIVMTNTSKDFDLVEEEIDNHLMEIIFMLFFVISAMHLNFSALLTFPIAIVSYVFLRLFGKVLGSYIGATISNSSDNIKKYMGFALIPQAGVAIGLALSLQKDSNFEAIAPIILNVVIATTLIHELAGPIITKYIIEKVGESHKEDLERFK